MRAAGRWQFGELEGGVGKPIGKATAALKSVERGAQVERGVKSETVGVQKLMKSGCGVFPKGELSHARTDPCSAVCRKSDQCAPDSTAAAGYSQSQLAAGQWLTSRHGV